MHKIRRGVPRDLPFIYEIEKSSFRYPYGEPLLRSILLLNPKSFFVAVWDGRVIGYVVGTIEVECGHLVSLAVHPNFRRRGVGEKLLKRLLKTLKLSGVKKVYLEVRKSNVAAQGLYAKLAFKSSRTIPSYYLDGEDAVEMIVTL